MNYVKTVPTWANNTSQYTAARINDIFYFTRSYRCRCWCWWWCWRFILQVRPLNSCFHKFQDGCLSIVVLVFRNTAIPSSGMGTPPAACALFPILSEWREFADVHSGTAVIWETTCKWHEPLVNSPNITLRKMMKRNLTEICLVVGTEFANQRSVERP